MAKQPRQFAITAWRQSAFNRPPAGVGDRDADDLDRPAVFIDGVAPCCCKPGADEAGDHVAIEPMGEHEQILGDAVRNAGEQRQRLALFRAEVNSRQTNVPQRQNFLYMPPYAASLMKRRLTRIRDPEALDLDRLATRPHSLGHDRCEPGEHKPCQHVTCESVGEHKHLSQAARGGGEDHERTSLIRAEAWFWWGCRHP